MNQRATVTHALVVVLKATVLALSATAVISAVILIIPYPGNGWAVALALVTTMWTGLALLAFFPCLLIAAIALTSFQRKNQAARDGMESGYRQSLLEKE
ncbi:hypothetical protein KDAU_54760 [Dictyobacter aurantiacus]|uniref:Uncharacterized protein n=2 Tax=Dictyobacter aurantiacus TaxID=1936993 RepID=A0A401ZMP4_9CHLR|nr:hypothetical protein KDAU_54760 [Dictyobacter aurantiacus]